MPPFACAIFILALGEWITKEELVLHSTMEKSLWPELSKTTAEGGVFFLLPESSLLGEPGPFLFVNLHPLPYVAFLMVQ